MCGYVMEILFSERIKRSKEFYSTGIKKKIKSKGLQIGGRVAQLRAGCGEFMCV